jgi:hypothetical protein
MDPLLKEENAKRAKLNGFIQCDELIGFLAEDEALDGALPALWDFFECHKMPGAPEKVDFPSPLWHGISWFMCGWAQHERDVVSVHPEVSKGANGKRNFCSLTRVSALVCQPLPPLPVFVSITRSIRRAFANPRSCCQHWTPSSLKGAECKFDPIDIAV